jgi:tetratricopeptide (TPR) repeat protein
MFRRYVLPLFAGIAFVLSTTLLVAAQSGQMRGHVTIKKADGTIVPAADAVVDIFRTDTAGDFTLKTNKKGDFIHAGLPLLGTYTVAVSVAGAQPSYVANVRAGGEDEIKIELAPGDGRRLTRDEIKTLMSGAGPATGSAKETSEERAKREEIERKNKEIAAGNEKAKNANATVEKTFKAGNEALKAKNYDSAIALYDEGIAADPEHPGAPSLMTNKALALNARGVEKYNTALKTTDEAAKTAAIDAAKKDWQAAFDASNKAVAMLKAAPVPSDATAANNQKQTTYYALLARSEATRLFVTKVDQTKADMGVTAFQEYIAVEVDPIKKAKAEHDLAQMLFDANVFDQALAAYQKILETNPDDLNALLRSGQALFNIGALNSDKAKYQLAANYLGRFVDKAPDTDPYKADAKAILEALKDQENVKAEKTTPAVRRPRRP